MTKPTSSPVASPKGTRDLYPDQYLRQNYITRLWRDTALRHGFEEINGPTFEMLELYTRKSGEGIVGELFRFRREGGEDDYALRPEFTPTLARMYAAKAASLPSPTKWFSIGPYFRAEKPQRGRLREFLQWNVDVLGGDEEIGDSDVLSCMTAFLLDTGLHEGEVTNRVSDRRRMTRSLVEAGVSESNQEQALALLDRKDKVDPDSFRSQAVALGMSESAASSLLQGTTELAFEDLTLIERMVNAGFESGWFAYDPSIVRGLAYYTGTVFEVIAEGERAIAGGGRYDNLIELFGGPPTPAVGFGMGDVVLGLLLDDKGLMPQGAELMDALSRPGASLRPEAFVVAGSEDEDPLVEPLLANLRRGVEREGFDGKPWAADRYAVRPMHARRTYKTTRNLKKLLNDAEKQHARFAIVLHGADKVQVKDLDKREELVHDRGDFSVEPASDAYVGKAIAQRLT
ncbi:MAG: ATP phosphoribosyltransferase regulatory subunit [Phycisphaerales bacterium]